MENKIEVLKKNNLDAMNDLIMSQAMKVANSTSVGDAKQTEIETAKVIMGLGKVSVSIASTQIKIEVAKYESLPPATELPRQLQ